MALTNQRIRELEVGVAFLYALLLQTDLSPGIVYEALKVVKDALPEEDHEFLNELVGTLMDRLEHGRR